MKPKLHGILTLIIAFVVQIGFAQQQTVTGTVTDENGLPLPGVNIIIKGTSTGVQTDFDGYYLIEPSQGDILVFSFIGYSRTEIPVANQNTIDVTLNTDASVLDEVLVVGYGTSSRRTLTDNIASISADEINEVPVPSLQSALVGKAAGVQITQVNGKVESGIKIRVRGVSTISSSQDPLYVIDGIPLINSDENINDSPINPLISLNPNDIASI